MSRISTLAGSLCVVFLLACMGGDGSTDGTINIEPALDAPKSVEPKGADPAADPGGDDAKTPDAGDDPADANGEGDWCCEYTGPNGKLQALIDNPKECEEKFGSEGGTFIKGAQCAPVCCKYPNDQADLGKGYTYETIADGNCSERKGTSVDKEEVGNDARACLGPDGAKPVPTSNPGPRPRGPGRITRPGGRSGGGATRPRSGGGGGRITRPR